MTNEGMKISGGFCLMMAAMLLMIPIKWLAAAIIAAAFHELCHYLAICYLSGKTQALRLNAFAARLPLPEMSSGREALCALAGPIGGLTLLLCAHWMPRLAICGAMQSFYNLLPIYPLDGGRALRNALVLILPPPRAATVCGALEKLCKVCILLLAIYGSIWLRLGLFPLFMAFFLLIRLKAN